MRLSSFLRIALASALTALTFSAAEAANLALDVTGQFGPTTTLNGTPLGTNTPFSFHAVFDPLDNVNPTPAPAIFDRPSSRSRLPATGHLPACRTWT